MAPVKVGKSKKRVWEGHKPTMSSKSKLRAIAKKKAAK